MSYLLHVIAREVSPDDAEVFTFLKETAGHTVSMAPSQQLKNFRDAALRLFAGGISPWADAAFADNFRGGYGRVEIAHRHDEVIPQLLRLGSDLGLTMVDEQKGSVHRPLAYQVVLEGPLDGVAVDVAARQLAALMNQAPEQMLALLHSRRRTLVKKGLTRTQGEVYVAALRERASCRATVTLEPRRPAAPPAAMAQPEHEGSAPDDVMYRSAEAQRIAAMALASSVVLLVLAVVVRLNLLLLLPAFAAVTMLGAVAVIRRGAARFAPLALVPGIGSLLVGWTYLAACGDLCERGLTVGNALLDADEVRALGGLDEKAMLPSSKIMLAALLLAVAGGLFAARAAF